MTQLTEEQQKKADVTASRVVKRWLLGARNGRAIESVLLERDKELLERYVSAALLDAAAHRNYECVTVLADKTLWCATCAARAEYLRGRSDAATSMRDKCVTRSSPCKRLRTPRHTTTPSTTRYVNVNP